MNWSQTLRIALLLAAIFAAGFISGRVTGSRPPAIFAAAGGRAVNADILLGNVNRNVGLDAEQQTKLRPILEEVAQAMAHAPIGSQERLEIFRKCVPRMRAVLRPDQYAAFDDFVRLTEKRYEQVVRRFNGPK